MAVLTFQFFAKLSEEKQAAILAEIHAELAGYKLQFEFEEKTVNSGLVTALLHVTTKIRSLYPHQISSIRGILSRHIEPYEFEEIEIPEEVMDQLECTYGQFIVTPQNVNGSVEDHTPVFGALMKEQAVYLQYPNDGQIVSIELISANRDPEYFIADQIHLVGEMNAVHKCKRFLRYRIEANRGKLKIDELFHLNHLTEAGNKVDIVLETKDHSSGKSVYFSLVSFDYLTEALVDTSNFWQRMTKQKFHIIRTNEVIGVAPPTPAELIQARLQWFALV